MDQFRRASEDYEEIGRRTTPWLGWPEPTDDTLDVTDPQSVRRAWEQAFGVNMDDPSVQAQIDAFERVEVPEPP